MRFIISIVLLFSTIFSWGQIVLKKTNQLAMYKQWLSKQNQQKLYKWQLNRTLSIPFFEDFSQQSVYPDSAKWINNQTYINSSFPINPPSYGVATFDNLNEKGNPYFGLNELLFAASDTLCSQYINLRDSGALLYKIKDSIMFSFFYQPQGNGDPSDVRDSFVLQFKARNQWNSVWRTRGSALKPFTQIFIMLKDTALLHQKFQFRFINYIRQTGNMNQFHLDYILLAKKRSVSNPYHNDYAIQNYPTSIFKQYANMPYKQFQSSDLSNTIYINGTNLSATTLNIEAKQTYIINNGTPISTTFSSNAANILSQNFAKRQFAKVDIPVINSPITVDREYEIREPSVLNPFRTNDKIKTRTILNNFYAYDDGSAEYGFGYDDDVVDPFYQGAIAYQFNLNKSDTLKAISVFFNQSTKDVQYLKFNIKVWKTITVPPATGRSQDVVLASINSLLPQYTDSLNGFHIFYLDTPILLPSGSFYIGWEQQGNQHLNVGYDINNGHHEIKANDQLYWLDRGSWQKVGFEGALMMRPYLGNISNLTASNKSFIQKIQISPNPFYDKIFFENQDGSIYQIQNYEGKIMESGIIEANRLNLEHLKSGLYLISIQNKSGFISRNKIIKL